MVCYFYRRVRNPPSLYLSTRARYCEVARSVRDAAWLTSCRWESVNLALGVVAPVLVAYEMFRFFVETLTPRTVMATKFITLGVALGALVLDVFAHIKADTRGKYTILALVVGSIFM